MKGTLLRAFSAVIVMALVISVAFADHYVQTLITEDAKMEKEKLQEEKLAAVEAEKQSEVRETKLKEMQQRIQKDEEQARESATYYLQMEDLKSNIFTNKVDGYTIRIPRDMQVDMS
ncbi:MAG: hypothetical protein AAGU75_09965, partial [Bacillota bacterium]